MTLEEVAREQARPENADRVQILVREEGPVDRPTYVAEWDGEEVRASNPFGLDSALQAAGAPLRRNVFLLDRGL